MINSLVNRIKQDAETLSSSEITEAVKVAWVVPTLVGGAGLLAGGALGSGLMYRSMKEDKKKLKEEAENKSLLYGALGATAGFGAGKILGQRAPSMDALGYSPDPGSSHGFNAQDMNYIMGR